ncbi:hypothetical protein Xcel_0565 [Xylanimonas cellulosilytica DSM 15894]|uniref:Uncharacterized protein n=1 Tax=Xylanimonas cellulosilytica (strain DSM 15894 / JCM 12276 / CECT 5975 / KCTC 9989 / LMG 20990 / NBRC 107835 / XIL07) TaxID=446471 RepID=D1BWM2_XYLCX|nr:hypothetical protein [Xylanimonas cellulosilytica]ACZ29604.1 hypothetical protein Xcel_0565 [Xylanimonas cellulosilytica DSM 15894]
MQQHSTVCAIRGTYQPLTIRDHQRREGLIAVALTGIDDAEQAREAALSILFGATAEDRVDIL